MRALAGADRDGGCCRCRSLQACQRAASLAGYSSLQRGAKMSIQVKSFRGDLRKAASAARLDEKCGGSVELEYARVWSCGGRRARSISLCALCAAL